jgi:hypothetical protein
MAADSTHKGWILTKGKIGMGTALACMTMLAVSGCTQTSSGTPSPTNGAPATSSAASNATSGADTAPTITNPRDLSKFTADPCLSITSAQATDLAINAQGKRVNIQSGESCGWKYGPNLESDIGVIYIVPDAKNGLQNLYNQRAAGWYDKGYFEPTTIDGYPAAYQDGSDYRQKGRCQLTVGINEQAFFTVMNRGPVNTNLCKGATKVANAVVETIKRG